MTAATRSLRFLCHRQRSVRSPHRPAHRTSCKALSLRDQFANWSWQSASPVPMAPLPKGGWHGEAVTGGFFTPPHLLYPSVGATLAVARGRGRAPPLRTTRYAFVGADAYIGPNQVFPHPRQGTRALPYKNACRAGPMCPAAHQPPHPL